MKHIHIFTMSFFFLFVIRAFQLKTIEALLGSSAKVGEVIVFGMVTQLKEVTLRKKFLKVGFLITAVFPDEFLKLFPIS